MNNKGFATGQRFGFNFLPISSAMANNKVCKRSANYTNREVHTIMEEYIKRKNILENSNSGPQQNIELKRKAWVEITDHVNVISPTKRSYTEVRRKVSDMKSSAKRKMLRYLKQSLSDESKPSLSKPQIDERLLEILQENGVIPPYKSVLRRGMSEPADINRPHFQTTPDDKNSPENNLSCGGGSTVSIPVSVVEVSCSPPVTAESVAATDTAHTVTPSSGYDTQSDPHRLKHLRDSVDRLTTSVDKLGDTLVKISRSLERIVESNELMFNTINSNVNRILESQQIIQSPRVNRQQ